MTLANSGSVVSRRSSRSSAKRARTKWSPLALTSISGRSSRKEGATMTSTSLVLRPSRYFSIAMPPTSAYAMCRSASNSSSRVTAGPKSSATPIRSPRHSLGSKAQASWRTSPMRKSLPRSSGLITLKLYPPTRMPPASKSVRNSHGEHRKIPVAVDLLLDSGRFERQLGGEQRHDPWRVERAARRRLEREGDARPTLEGDAEVGGDAEARAGARRGAPANAEVGGEARVIDLGGQLANDRRRQQQVPDGVGADARRLAVALEAVGVVHRSRADAEAAPGRMPVEQRRGVVQAQARPVAVAASPFRSE